MRALAAIRLSPALRELSVWQERWEAPRCWCYNTGVHSAGRGGTEGGQSMEPVGGKSGQDKPFLRIKLMPEN